MAGTFLLGERKVRPGTYFRVSSGDVTTVGAINGIAACVFSSDWGEVNKVVSVDQSMLNNLREYFGTQEAVDAIRELLLGGATTVKAIRVGGAGEIKPQFISIHAADDTSKIALRVEEKSYSSKTLTATLQTNSSTGKRELIFYSGTQVYEKITFDAADNEVAALKTALQTSTHFQAGISEKSNAKLKDFSDQSLGGGDSTPKPQHISIHSKEDTTKVALRVEARCPGTMPLTATLKTNLASGKRELTIYDETRVLEAIEFDKTDNDVSALRAALSSSKWFKAGMSEKSNSTFDDFAGVSLTGGVNPTHNVEDYQAALDVLENHYWNVIVAGSSSANIKSLLADFVKQSYATGHLGMTVIPGSHLDQYTPSLEDRMKEAQAYNDWRVVYVLDGWTGLNGKAYRGWRAAARIGGMIAACETNASLTHITIDGAVELAEHLTGGQITEAEEKGCLVLTYNEDGQVWVDNAINTLTTLGNDMDAGFKKIRRTKCRFELITRINRTCDKLIGRLSNNEHGRATLITAMNGIIKSMIAEGKLFEGSYAAEDARYKPEGDTAHFIAFVDDTDSLEKIMLTYEFSYARRLA